jgi:nucleotide sugar dehydrogenase
MLKTDRAVSIAPDGSVYTNPTEDMINKSFIEIRKKAYNFRRNGKKVVVVQGLGFVGAAVAAVIADAVDSSGDPLFLVIGTDICYWKVAKINEGLPPVLSSDHSLSGITWKAVVEKHNLYATTSEKAYELADVIVVDIPLDVEERLVSNPEEIEVNLESFTAALNTIGRKMRPDCLVLVETTVPAGTIENVVKPLLIDERVKRNIDSPLYLAHAYERVMPGPKYVDSIKKFWRTYSGIDNVSADKAKDFLESFIDTQVYPLTELRDTASSEMAKLLENSYRSVNIALIHEWALMAEKMGVDLFSVVDSIRIRKGTHDNMRTPGFGVGGYCLTKDSLLAQWSLHNFFKSEHILDMTMDALSVNYNMPLHTLNLLKELAQEPLTGKTISVMGVSYLPGVADTRNSPTELLVDELNKAGATVIVNDPHVNLWQEKPDIHISHDIDECIRYADGIVFTVNHDEYKLLTPENIIDTMKEPVFIVDAQNIISDEKAFKLNDSGCRLAGVGKGHWRKEGLQCLKVKHEKY